MNSQLVKIQEIQSKKKKCPQQSGVYGICVKLPLLKVFRHDLGNRGVMMDKTDSDTNW